MGPREKGARDPLVKDKIRSNLQSPLVQILDSTIQCINHCPVDMYQGYQ